VKINKNQMKRYENKMKSSKIKMG